MTHPSLGRIQKQIIRQAFDVEHYQSSVTGEQLLPDSVLYREKEQFADGVGNWINQLQSHATDIFPDLSKEEAECSLYSKYLSQQPGQSLLKQLIQSRKQRRKKHAQKGTARRPGQSQPKRWYCVCDDQDLRKLYLTKDDANTFLTSVLGWDSSTSANSFSPNLDNLNQLIMSMLERVPFHNLTLLTRERRPPTMDEIKVDMMSGVGGPCAVVNAFFAVLLDVLGFGPDVYLLRYVYNMIFLFKL